MLVPAGVSGLTSPNWASTKSIRFIDCDSLGLGRGQAHQSAVRSRIDPLSPNSPARLHVPEICLFKLSEVEGLAPHRLQQAGLVSLIRKFDHQLQLQCLPVHFGLQ